MRSQGSDRRMEAVERREPTHRPVPKQGYTQYHTSSYRSSARDRSTSRTNRSDNVGCRTGESFCRFAIEKLVPFLFCHSLGCKPKHAAVLATIFLCDCIKGTGVYQLTDRTILYSRSRRRKTTSTNNVKHTKKNKKKNRYR